MPKPITHVATTDISDMMAPGSGRRMPLPGFDAEFVDFPHYIVCITERIWHDRQIDLSLKYYSDDCTIHTLAGDIRGAQTVVDNTHATIAAFPDRRLDADNVIWSDEGDGAFYSSHLITSGMTNSGASEFGPATGKHARILTIADCLCRENRIVEEWLVRDNLGLVRQLGLDPADIARKQAYQDKERGFDLIGFHTTNRGQTALGNTAEPSSSAAEVALAALEANFISFSTDVTRNFYDFRVDACYPGAARLYGPDDIAGWLAPLKSALSDMRLSIGHIAEIPYLGDARDVAIRWSLVGQHTADGRYGIPTMAPLYVLGVSQFRIINGRVRQETSIWDDLAVLRQVETAKLAQ